MNKFGSSSAHANNQMIVKQSTDQPKLSAPFCNLSSTQRLITLSSKTAMGRPTVT